MSAFTDVLAAHSRVRHPRAETDFALMCACGWETIVTLDEIEYEPDRYLDAEPILLARHAAHVEVELAKAGIAITQLPEQPVREVQYVVICERRRETVRFPAHPERKRAELNLLLNGGVLIREERLTTPWREVERLQTSEEYRAQCEAEWAAEDAADAAAASIPTKETPNA